MPEFILPRGKRPRALKLAQDILETLPEDRAFRVTVEEVKSTRTTAQNAYLFGVCYPMISEVTGYEKEEVHTYFLGTHFGWKDRKVPKTPRNPSGVESVPVRTTTTDEHGKRSVLPILAFSDYVAFVQRFAAIKLGIVIPDPDQMHQDEEKAA